MLLRGKKGYRSDTQQTKLPAHQSPFYYCRIPPRGFYPCVDHGGDDADRKGDADLTVASLQASSPYCFLASEDANSSP